ncbi:MAG: Hpt domain-containing protein [Pseudomonadota bacterium]
MKPPFDRAHLSTFTGGDAELERELLLSFQENAGTHLENLRQGLESGTWPELAHRFKGAASGIGMQVLAGLCAEAEALGATIDQDSAEKLIARMQVELTALDQYLEK